MAKKTFKRKLNPNPEQAHLYDKITYLQTKIIQKINNLKKIKPNFNLCDHLQNNHIQQNQQYHSTINYYDKYWKQYLITASLIKKINEFQQQITKIQNQLVEIEKKITQRQNLLNLPALSKIKKPIFKNTQKIQPLQKQQESEHLQNNPVAQLKKQQQVEPQFINYHHQQSFENHIFYE